MSLRVTIANLRGRLRALAGHGFIRSVAVLIGGTALAQALSVLVLPLLTRLYTPDDFSVLAVFMSILGILSVIACMRLEVAIPLPERDEDAANLLALSLAFAAILSLITALTIALFEDHVIALIKQPKLRPYLWMVPLGMWAGGTYTGVQYWATRKQNFSRLARTRIVQSVGGAVTQTGLGWAGHAPFGLLLGQLINNGAGLIDLGRDAWRTDRQALRAVRLSRMYRALSEHRRFPTYSVLDGLTNAIGIQGPIIIIAAAAVGPEAGYVSLATRVMAIPMGLVGGAVAQVYLSRAPAELRAGTLGPFTIEILGGLIRAGVGPLLFAGLVARPVFALIFGSEWERAGELVAWMTPWFLLQFLASPVSVVMYVTERQLGLFLTTLGGLVIRLGSTVVAYMFCKGLFSELYALSGAIFYAICVVVFYGAAGVSLRDIFVACRRSALVPLAWTLFGVLVRGGMEWIRS